MVRVVRIQGEEATMWWLQAWVASCMSLATLLDHPPRCIGVNNMNILDLHIGGCCNDGSSNSVVCPWCHPGCHSPKEGHWKGSVDPVQPIGHPGDWIEVASDTERATQVSCMTHLASNWLNCSVESSRWGSAHMSIVPYQVETNL